MCVCQIAISAAQLGVCAWHFKEAPTRDAVNIAVCAVSLPLVAAGLTALNNPEDSAAVAVMQVYQYFFLLRSALVCFDYGWLVDTRKVHDTTRNAIVLATIVLVAILVLQLLNSLLVMAVIRIMRKKRNEAVARQASSGKAGDDAAAAAVPATEATPLLGAQSGGYVPPEAVPP